ncbi:hypothetical protein [Pseudomonas gozinkensis]|uniref:hypothetical protein n=1 Tax=Pseudomonas gozinkensis TaxID=2774461 RepID=UPI00178829C2|nr:hypothetical protein [Pseudomonas gozinkensis]
MIDEPVLKVSRLASPVADSQPRLPTIADAVRISPLPLAESASIRSVLLSLKQYRLSLSVRLPEPDAQGLRSFKGRQFVDVGPGEIVQVQRDTTTGEYRAMLPSEGVASGPTLVLDRQTMIWKAEQVSILSDINGVINDRVDSSADSLRHSASPDSPGRFYEGRDDRFERQVSETVTIVARGLEQFSPQHSAILRTKLRATQRIFSDAKDGVTANYVEAAGILEGYFGQHHELVSERFTDCLSRGEALSREYQGPWGLDKFVAVESDPDRSAWMYPLDFHGRFFISLNWLDAGDYASVLGHEMLHTNRVNRFVSVGPGALDFFYLDAQLGHALDRPVPVYEIAEQGISEVIMQGGLTVAYLEGFTSDHDSFIAGVAHRLGRSDKLDIQMAVDLFNANPSVRSQMASNNADSIIYAAKSLQTLHMARTADSQLMSRLLVS